MVAYFQLQQSRTELPTSKLVVCSFLGGTELSRDFLWAIALRRSPSDRARRCSFASCGDVTQHNLGKLQAGARRKQHRIRAGCDLLALLISMPQQAGAVRRTPECPQDAKHYLTHTVQAAPPVIKAADSRPQTSVQLATTKQSHLRRLSNLGPMRQAIGLRVGQSCLQLAAWHLFTGWRGTVR